MTSEAFNPLFAGDTVYSEFGHDPKGNPTSIRDENGKQDALLYDALDRLEKISQVRTATYETDFAYDALSNVTRVTDAAGKATDLLHDDRGNLVETLSPDTGRTRFLYDAAGNLVHQDRERARSGQLGRARHHLQLRRPRSLDRHQPPERPRLDLHVRHRRSEEPEGPPRAR